MTDRNNAVSVLHNTRDGISELFSGERIAAGIVHDMVARLDPDLIGADRVVGRGWRSALQVDGLQAHKDNAAFWQEMYGYYRTVCANTQSLLGDVSAFAVLFQANEDTSNWSPENVAQIVQFCRQVPEPSVVEPVETVDPAPELEHDEPGHDVVSEDIAQDKSVDTENVNTADDSDNDNESDNESESESEHPTPEPEFEPEPEQVDESEKLDEPDQPAKKATTKDVSQQPNKRRRSRKKPGKPQQKKTRPQRKVHQAPDREMSTKTAESGVIQPVDLDFRVNNAEHNAEIMPYIRSEVHADAAHIKSSVSGVHLYLAHIAFDLLDEGLRARGVAHNLGLGSALSALLLAVLPVSKTQYLKLSPMMEEAVDVMRKKLDWSSSEHLIDISESMSKSVSVLRDMFEMTSLVHQEAQVNSYVSSLNLAERVGATNLPVGIQPEHIEVDNVAAQEIARRVREQIIEDELYSAQREKRSANFFKNKEE